MRSSKRRCGYRNFRPHVIAHRKGRAKAIYVELISCFRSADSYPERNGSIFVDLFRGLINSDIDPGPTVAAVRHLCTTRSVVGMRNTYVMSRSTAARRAKRTY